MKKSFKFSLLFFLIGMISISQTRDNRQKFRIGFNGSKIDHRQILLTIDDRTSDKFDWGYDGEIYQLFEDDFFWMVDGKKCVIQATNNIGVDKELAIGVTSSGGDITIKVDALENYADQFMVLIKDKETGEVYDIQNDVFTMHLPKGNYTNRFAIIFKSSNTVDTNPPFLTQDLLIHYDKYDTKIKVSSVENTIVMSTVNLYTSVGQLIKSWPSSQTLEYSVIAKPGIYFVQTITSRGNLTKRIIIK